MFALGLRYLMGWSMAAADGARKERAEWPPHPDRVFMAIAAAWFETAQDSAQGAAIRWLETLRAPAVAASGASFRYAHAEARPPLSYVPVNDVQCGRALPSGDDLVTLKANGLAVLPEHRVRHPRAFPVAIPDNPIVYFIWPDADVGAHRGPLEELLANVNRVGHSASLVHMWIEDVPPPATWWPCDGPARHRLRVFGPGRLAYLNERKGLPPEPARWQGYGPPPRKKADDVPASVFDASLVVFKLRGRPQSLPMTLRLTEALRGLVLSACPTPIPEWVSGHAPASSAPSRRPHLALFPLPFVGHDHADGRLLGVALAIPKGIDPREATHCLTPILWDRATGAPPTLRLFAGRWFECTAELECREAPPRALHPETWTQPSRVWATVTPIVLDRHFKGPDRWHSAAANVKNACEHIGLPCPTQVLLHPVSLIEGVPPAREFPHLVRKNGGGQVEHSHAVLMFSEPVRGPVLLGAGRYRGYGLCRPVEREGGHA